MSTESNDTRDELEFKKLRVETRKMLADMEHDISQREHWKETRDQRLESNDAQIAHWKRQQRYWTIIAIVAALGIILNAIAKILPSLSWFNGS